METQKSVSSPKPLYTVYTLMNSYSAENRSASVSSCCACKYQIVILSLQFCVHSYLLKLFFFNKRGDENEVTEGQRRGSKIEKDTGERNEKSET